MVYTIAKLYSYNDDYGNFINYSGVEKNGNFRVTFKGSNNYLYLSKDIQFTNLNINFFGNNAECIINNVGWALHYPANRFNFTMNLGTNSHIYMIMLPLQVMCAYGHYKIHIYVLVKTVCSVIIYL